MLPDPYAQPTATRRGRQILTIGLAAAFIAVVVFVLVLQTRDLGRRPAALSDDVTTSSDAGLVWVPCDEDAESLECASLSVPLDYTLEGGPRIDLGLIRMPATGSPTERIGSLLVNPGGPGGSGVEFLDGARDVFSADLRRRFDIVAWDPRGVGQSENTNCAEPSAYSDLAEQAERRLPEERFAAWEEWVRRCWTLSDRLLPYLGTENVARDLDLVREALGDEKLSYLGYSYGTEIGAVYAALFPERVRAMVLDSAVAPWDRTTLDFAVEQARGRQKAFDDFLAQCAFRPDCPFNNGTDLRARFEETLARVEEGGGWEARQAALNSLGYFLYQPDGLPALGEILAAAGEGYFDGLLEERDTSFYDYAGAFYAVMCADFAPPESRQQLLDAEAALEADGVLFTELLRHAPAACLTWPDAADPLPRPSDPVLPPVVVIGGLHDPATPYGWAEELAATFDDGRLVTWNGPGHGAYGGWSACIDAAVDSYLIELVEPAAGLACDPDPETLVGSTRLLPDVDPDWILLSARDAAESAFSGVADPEGPRLTVWARGTGEARELYSAVAIDQATALDEFFEPLHRERVTVGSYGGLWLDYGDVRGVRFDKIGERQIQVIGQNVGDDELRAVAATARLADLDEDQIVVSLEVPDGFEKIYEGALPLYAGERWQSVAWSTDGGRFLLFQAVYDPPYPFDLALWPLVMTSQRVGGFIVFNVLDESAQGGPVVLNWMAPDGSSLYLFGYGYDFESLVGIVASVHEVPAPEFRRLLDGTN